MRIFVTVGSTGFDTLVGASTSSDFLNSISSMGYSELLVQYGSSKDVFLGNVSNYKESKIDIQGYDYKPTIEEDIQNAHLIISHSGSGTILQALRQHKKLVIVVNETLLDNHQVELAQAMAIRKYVIYGDIRYLSNAVAKASKEVLEVFPDPNPALFANALNKSLGFI